LSSLSSSSLFVEQLRGSFSIEVERRLLELLDDRQGSLQIGQLDARGDVPLEFVRIWKKACSQKSAQAIAWRGFRGLLGYWTVLDADKKQKTNKGPTHLRPADESVLAEISISAAGFLSPRSPGRRSCMESLHTKISILITPFITDNLGERGACRGKKVEKKEADVL
jgi:hypothetical protein